MYEDRLDGRLSTEDYDHKVKEFGAERELLTENLKRLNSENTEYYKVGFAIHELALRARDIYRSQKATIEERRELLAYAFAKVSVLKGEVSPELTKGFSFLAEWMPKVNAVLELEPKTGESVDSSYDLEEVASSFPMKLSNAQKDSRTEEKPSTTRVKGLSPLQISTLLRGQDSNLRPID